MGRRIFIIDDDSVAREIELMLEIKKMQRRIKSSSLMYGGESNVVPYHTCEERNSGCGVSHSGCGVSHSVCGWERPSYGCGGGGCGSYHTYRTC